MPVLLGSWITKSFPVLVSLNIFSVRFRPSGLMLKSVIHLELSFLQIKKYGFSILLLHLAIQFAQYPLLKMLPLLQYYFCLCKKKRKKRKSGVCRYGDLCKSLQFYSIDQCVCFCARIMLLFIL